MFHLLVSVRKRLAKNEIDKRTETHLEHPKYSNVFAPHEAGYDSLLTAKVLIRLSTKLEVAGTYLANQEPSEPSDDEFYYTASEGGGVRLAPSEVPQRSSMAVEIGDADGSTAHSVSSMQDAESDCKTVKKKRRRRRRKAKRSKEVLEEVVEQSAFSHTTRFDLLGDLPNDDQSDNEVLDEAPEHQFVESESFVEETNGPCKPKRSDLMPPFDSPFWKVYGNKLRVFGTVENVCHLAMP